MAEPIAFRRRRKFSGPLTDAEFQALTTEEQDDYRAWQQEYEQRLWDIQQKTAARLAARREAKKVEKAPKVESHATKLLKMVAELCAKYDAELFRAPSGEGYLRAPVLRRQVNDKGTDSIEVDYFDNFPLTHGSIAAEYLRGLYLFRTDKSISSGALHDVIETLNGQARLQGAEQEVFTRIAGFDDRVVLDLVNAGREVVIVTADGWSVGPCPKDVRFVRRPGMLPLPRPVVTTESLRDLIPSMLNITDERSLQLLIGWWVVAVRGRKPYFILVVRGEAGSAKTTGADIIRSVIDPNEATSSSAPKDERDLMIASRGCHVGSFDNLSYLNDDLSDALCRIATGSGLRTRKLHTDDTEVIFKAARPIIVNGIPDILNRSDLASRALVIELDPIADTQRQTEADVYARVNEQRPQMLSALLNVLVEVLRRQPVMPKPERLPRMADAAVTIMAAEPALGWEEGTWMSLMDQNDEENASSILTDDPIFEAINSLPLPWSGDLKEFMKVLPATDEKSKVWTAKGVGNRLRRMTGAARLLGIVITPPRGQETEGALRGKRLWSLARVAGALVQESGVPVDEAPF